MSKTIGILCALVVAAGAVCVACADEPTPNHETAVRIVQVKTQFEQLLSAMDQAAVRLEKSDPDAAQAIRQAAKQARDGAVVNKMDDVVVALTKAQTFLAADKQGKVVAQLQAILELLKEGPQRAINLPKWEDMRNRIGALIGKEKGLALKSDLAANAADLDAKFAGLARQAAAIRATQVDLMNRAGKAGVDDALVKLARLLAQVRAAIRDQAALSESCGADAPAADLAKAGNAQEELAEAAAAMGGRLSDAGKDAAIIKALTAKKADPKAPTLAGEYVTQAAGCMAKAAEHLSAANAKRATEAATAQEQARYDLWQAEKILAAALATAAADTPAAKLGAEQGELAAAASKLAGAIDDLTAKVGGEKAPKTGDLNAAAGHMNKASQKLGSQNPSGATGDQQKALDALDGVTAQLAKLHRRAMDEAKEPADGQARDQNALARAAEKLAGEMAGQGEGKPAAPGADKVGQAGGSMASAGGKLGKGDSKGAHGDQDDALDKLRSAYDDLTGAIAGAQLQQRQQALAKLEEMLQKILTAQQGLTGQTLDLDRKKTAGESGRPEEVRLAEVAASEGKQAQEVTKVVDLLKADGTTAVFPEVLGEVGKDLASIEQLLRDRKTGALTQVMQGEVEKSLAEMIQALRKEASKPHGKKPPSSNNPPPEQGGPPPGGKPDPLVPPVAELKMLRNMQDQVNTRTRLLDAQTRDGAMPQPEVDAQHKTLSDREQKVETLARQMKAAQ